MLASGSYRYCWCVPLVVLLFCCPAQARHKHISALSAIPAALQTAVGERKRRQVVEQHFHAVFAPRGASSV